MAVRSFSSFPTILGGFMNTLWLIEIFNGHDKIGQSFYSDKNKALAFIEAGIIQDELKVVSHYSDQRTGAESYTFDEYDYVSKIALSEITVN